MSRGGRVESTCGCGSRWSCRAWRARGGRAVGGRWADLHAGGCAACAASGQVRGAVRHQQGVLPMEARVDDGGGGEGGDDVADVLVAGPQSKDEASALRVLGLGLGSGSGLGLGQG